jgi:hypothetical protein
MYNFKKFEKIHARFEERITITKSNSIGLPTFFCKKNNVANFKYAVLFWDKEKKAIGIQLTNDEEEKSKFRIMHHKKYGASIIARSFFKTYDINTEEYRGRYNWEKPDIEGVGRIFVIELKKQADK